jgi:hypothetical protein
MPMELDAVAFPALIVADDGWVQFVKTASLLTEWSTSAIRKYNTSRVLLYDRLERAWLLESIAPLNRRNPLLRLADPIRNPRIAVHIRIRPILEASTDAVRDALLRAIDADDDILTQEVEAPELKAQIETAKSFDAVVQVLKAARAIDA